MVKLRWRQWERNGTQTLRAVWKAAVRLTNLPGRVESFDGLFFIAPARRVFIFTGLPSTGHGALHVARYDMPQGLPHLGVLCCRDPRIGCREEERKPKKQFFTVFVCLLHAFLIAHSHHKLNLLNENHWWFHHCHYISLACVQWEAEDKISRA